MATDYLEVVGFAATEHLATELAKAFDYGKYVQAGHKVNGTVERALVLPYGFANSIQGWIVRVERRPITEAGKPWGPPTQLGEVK